MQGLGRETLGISGGAFSGAAYDPRISPTTPFRPKSGQLPLSGVFGPLDAVVITSWLGPFSPAAAAYPPEMYASPAAGLSAPLIHPRPECAAVCLQGGAMGQYSGQIINVHTAGAERHLYQQVGSSRHIPRGQPHVCMPHGPLAGTSTHDGTSASLSTPADPANHQQATKTPRPDTGIHCPPCQTKRYHTHSTRTLQRSPMKPINKSLQNHLNQSMMYGTIQLPTTHPPPTPYRCTATDYIRMPYLAISAASTASSSSSSSSSPQPPPPPPPPP